jgi:AraC-like DNA-binding protein
LDGAEKIAYVDQYFKQSGFNTEAFAIVTIRQLHLLVYIGLGFWALRRWERRIRQEFSNLEKLSLEWLRRLLLGFTIVVGAVWLTYGLILQGMLSLLDSNIIASLLVAGVIYSLGYLGFRQARQRLQWQVAQQAMQAQPQKSAPEKQTSQSRLDAATTERLLNRLNTLMQEEKLYTQAELSLQSLASQVGTQPYLLSELLNRHLNRSFFDYINQFRIEEVKTRLRSPESKTYTLLSIAMDAGFNSKSTFNEVFKKYTGQTPSAYRKAHRRIS